jgi:hypothetical protein
VRTCRDFVHYLNDRSSSHDDGVEDVVMMHNQQQQQRQDKQQQRRQQHNVEAEFDRSSDELYFQALHSAALSFEDPLVALVLLQKLGPSLRDLDLDSANVIITHTAKNAQFLRDWGRGAEEGEDDGLDKGDAVQSPSEFMPDSDRPRSRRGKRTHASSASSSKPQQPSPAGSGSGGSSMTAASPGVNYFVRGLEDSLGSPNAAPHGSDEDDEEYLQDDVSPPSLRSPPSRPSTSRGLHSREQNASESVTKQGPSPGQVHHFPPASAESGAYDYAEVVKSSSVSVSSSAADDGDSTTVESSQYHEDAQLGELLSDLILQAAQVGHLAL